MFCPTCGAHDQDAAFCTDCGARLRAATPTTVISNSTNVNVQVGTPIVVAGPRTRRVVAHKGESSVLRDAVSAILDACNEIVEDIEHGIGIDLLPVGSPVRARYMQALELRKEAAGLLDSAKGARGLSEARVRAGRAHAALQTTRDSLVRPPGATWS